MPILNKLVKSIMKGKVVKHIGDSLHSMNFVIGNLFSQTDMVVNHLGRDNLTGNNMLIAGLPPLFFNYKMVHEAFSLSLTLTQSERDISDGFQIYTIQNNN